MSILPEIDRAVFDALQVSDCVPVDYQFLIVLNVEARNEFLQTEIARRTSFEGAWMDKTYRGAVLAVTSNESMPRVTVFSKRLK